MRRITKACDVCRHARRRCKFDPDASECVTCLATGSQCVFNLPRMKRGRKSQLSHLAAAKGPSECPVSGVHEQGSDGVPICDTEDRVQSPADSLQTLSPANLVAASATMPAAVIPLPASGPGQICDNLNAAIVAAGCSREQIVEQCSALYMQWVFPVMPLIGPATLEDGRALSWGDGLESSWAVCPSGSGAPMSTIDRMRRFALLTSAYALVCVKVPTASFPFASVLVSPLLTASRAMLLCCEDQDVAVPNSSSLIIRTFHASVLHALGQYALSWYAMGHAVRLAQAMRLFEEDSFKNMNANESQLRRNVFWTLHTADKAASVFGKQTVTLHQTYLHASVRTKCECRPDQLSLLDRDLDTYRWPFEEYVHIASYLCHRLWALCDDILFSLRLLSRLRPGPDSEPTTSDDMVHMSVTDSYMDFCGILNEMPPWLAHPDSYVGSTEQITSYQRHAFWIQRADITITFHSLRFILLKEASDLKLSTLLGVTASPGLLALRQIEIAFDLAAAARALPFVSLRANGQPLVDKLRRVEASLLEIASKNENLSISSRAATLSSTLHELVAAYDDTTLSASSPCESSAPSA